ncbi:MAG: hypothetical protein ACXVWV_04335 [Nocardioides sp.]
MSRTSRGAAASLALLLAGLFLQVVGAPGASATTCQMVGSGQSRHQYCSGLHDEFIGSKFYKGEASYFNGQTQNVEASIYLVGKLKDKEADGNCTWLQFTVYNSYWPNGNTVTSPKYKICGAGTVKTLAFDIHGAYTYPGSKVVVQHCQDFGSQKSCSAFYTRKIPS